MKQACGERRQMSSAATIQNGYGHGTATAVSQGGMTAATTTCGTAALRGATTACRTTMVTTSESGLWCGTDACGIAQ